MVYEYTITRKLQEQSGSYFVTLPKIWVQREKLREGQDIFLVFNGIVKIIPPSYNLETSESSISIEEVEIE